MPGCKASFADITTANIIVSQIKRYCNCKYDYTTLRWNQIDTYKASAILYYNKEETLSDHYSRELSDATWLIDKMRDIFIGVFIILQIIGIVVLLLHK